MRESGSYAKSCFRGRNMSGIFIHNSTDVITIIFGLTSGILTLVGLISIFISFNSQHKIQYVREILWGLVSLPYEFGDTDKQSKDREVFRKIWLYKDITERQGDFTSTIIKVSRVSLFVVISIWSILGILLFREFYTTDFIFLTTSTIASITILIGFIYVLGKINNITKIGNLPSVDEIMDAGNLTTGVNTITLAAISMHLKIGTAINSEEKLQLSIGIPVPFSNFSIVPTVSAVGDTHDQTEFLFHSYDYMINIENGNAQWFLGSALLWYKILELDLNQIHNLRENITVVQIQVELHSLQGLVHVQYLIPVEDLRNIDFMNPYYSSPDYFHEIAMENTSNFAPWSIKHDDPAA